MSRRLLYLLLLPAVLLTGGYLFMRFSLRSSVKKEETKTGQSAPEVDSLGGKKLSAMDLRPLFIQRLQQLIQRSSAGLYTLSVGDMQVDVTTSKVSLSNVKLEPDAAKEDSLRKSNRLPENVLSVAFQELAIEGINLDDAVNSKKMDYKLIRLVRPKIVIHSRKGAAPKEKEDEDFSQRFLKGWQSLSINKVVVEGGTVVIYNGQSKSKPTVLNDVSVRMNNLLIDSATRKDKDRFLFAKEATLSFKNFSKPTPDGLYNLKIGSVTVQVPQQEISLSQFSFTSPFNRTEFTKRQTVSKELYNLVLPSVSLKNVDWWALLNEKEVVADNITSTGGSLSVYLDRSLPPVNSMGNFPSQLLMKLPLKINVAEAAFRHLEISYSERNPLSQQTGTVYMGNANISLANLSNEKRATPPPMTVKGSALFMNKVPLTANFQFDMKAYRSGKFSAQIKAEGFDGTLVNSFAEPMGLVRVDRGFLESAEATINGDETKASGNVFIPYRDLKLSLLEKDKGKKELDKKDFTSVLANVLLLKNSNPQKGGEPRREQAEFIRIKEGGFFMLVWKTLLVGALKTMGAPAKYANSSGGTPAQKQ